MNANVIFHDLAERELNETIDFYNSESDGLGEEFLHEVEIAVRQILEFPESAPLIVYPVRKKLIRRFPYAILYSNIPEGIWVLAVANQKRSPFYWIDRQ